MATTNNDAFGSKGAEIIQRTNGKPHLAMVEKAKAIDKDWMKGIGYARWLAKAR